MNLFVYFVCFVVKETAKVEIGYQLCITRKPKQKASSYDFFRVFRVFRG